jgi:hypothetical protein
MRAPPAICRVCRCLHRSRGRAAQSPSHSWASGCTCRGGKFCAPCCSLRLLSRWSRWPRCGNLHAAPRCALPGAHPIARGQPSLLVPSRALSFSCPPPASSSLRDAAFPDAQAHPQFTYHWPLIQQITAFHNRMPGVRNDVVCGMRPCCALPPARVCWFQFARTV